jgi:hypothetical protein
MHAEGAGKTPASELELFLIVLVITVITEALKCTQIVILKKKESKLRGLRVSPQSLKTTDSILMTSLAVTLLW